MGKKKLRNKIPNNNKIPSTTTTNISHPPIYKNGVAGMQKIAKVYDRIDPKWHKILIDIVKQYYREINIHKIDDMQTFIDLMNVLYISDQIQQKFGFLLRPTEELIFVFNYFSVFGATAVIDIVDNWMLQYDLPEESLASVSGKIYRIIRNLTKADLINHFTLEIKWKTGKVKIFYAPFVNATQKDKATDHYKDYLKVPEKEYIEQKAKQKALMNVTVKEETNRLEREKGLKKFLPKKKNYGMTPSPHSCTACWEREGNNILLDYPEDLSTCPNAKSHPKE